MPFNNIGRMMQDEEGNVTGGMFSASPIGRALEIGKGESRLAALAELVKYMLMGRGGVGSPGGISPKAVIRSPQITAEGNQLPSVAELHQNIPTRGQPKYRGPEVTRAMNRQSVNTPQDMPIFGSPSDVSRIAGESHGFPQVLSEGGAFSGLPGHSIQSGAGRATQMQNPQEHLKALQDLLTRIFTVQGRN